MARYLYSEIASAVAARLNSQTSGNTEWFEKWTERIRLLAKLLPHGSGFDHVSIINLDKSHGCKIVIETSFHHMNNNGYYDGWTEHTITVTPTFHGIDLRITGRNRNDIKDHIYETFSCILGHEVLTEGEKVTLLY